MVLWLLNENDLVPVYPKYYSTSKTNEICSRSKTKLDFNYTGVRNYSTPCFFNRMPRSKKWIHIIYVNRVNLDRKSNIKPRVTFCVAVDPPSLAGLAVTFIYTKLSEINL